MATSVTTMRTRRAVARVEERTMARMASVQGHAMVQAEKSDELDRLTRKAMGGQAMLSQWAATLAKDDPFLADD
ncbi:MAG: hypothetical protein U5R31_13225 [Acidimicrobiia bacterium]|nr:hypothetical protein [Acidimicrobiia bacterium]